MNFNYTLVFSFEKTRPRTTCFADPFFSVFVERMCCNFLVISSSTLSILHDQLIIVKYFHKKYL